MSASTSTLASKVNIPNSYNSFIFQGRRPKFCRVVDLNNSHRLFYEELIQNGRQTTRNKGRVSVPQILVSTKKQNRVKTQKTKNYKKRKQM